MSKIKDWNKGKKFPHSKEWEEKRIKAVKEFSKNHNYPKGYKRPESVMKPMKEGLRQWQLENPKEWIEHAIKNLPKDNNGEKNGNWRGGITALNYSWRLANYKNYTDWRKKILEKFNYKCANCGSTENPEVHHIVPLYQLKETAFEIWNGVCLCRKCHQETESWGGKNKEINSGGELRLLFKTIPHSWHEYPTIGNWKFTSSGILIIFVSEMGIEKFEFLVMIHELVEAILCKKDKIKESNVTKFDIEYEKERTKGLHSEEDEPGDDPRAPYHKQHRMAEVIERILAVFLGVKWQLYLKVVYSL